MGRIDGTNHVAIYSIVQWRSMIDGSECLSATCYTADGNFNTLALICRLKHTVTPNDQIPSKELTLKFGFLLANPGGFQPHYAGLSRPNHHA